MPRPIRPIADGLIYHVISRGNGRQSVFFDDGDYLAFLGAIADLKERKPFDLFGYCLMTNHIHLLLRPKGASISRIMQSLLVSHTQRYPAVRCRRWAACVHQLPPDDESQSIRRSNETGLPFGQPNWVNRLARKLKLDLTVRPRGRPRKQVKPH